MKIEKKAHVELSVHQLVDFLLRSGDIDNRVFNRSSQTEGSRLHSVYQSSQGKNYISEYPLSFAISATTFPCPEAPRIFNRSFSGLLIYYSP